jgi:hypothetical protein
LNGVAIHVDEKRAIKAMRLQEPAIALINELFTKHKERFTLYKKHASKL